MSISIGIRIAGLLVILAVVYEFLRKKYTRSIVDSLKEAGAVSPDTAVTAGQANGSGKGSFRFGKLLLRKNSVLRRYVKCVRPEEKGKKLTYEEARWYIPEEKEVPDVYLRLGGTNSVKQLVVGIVLTVCLTELLVFFQPKLFDLISDITSSFSK